MPLNITVLVLKRTAAYLEGSEAHTRPYLAELTGIIRCPDKHMMPDLYDIIDIFEGNNSATLRFALSRWQRGEEVLENFYNSLASWRGKSLKEFMSATVFVQDNESVIQDVTLRVSCPRLESSHALDEENARMCFGHNAKHLLSWLVPLYALNYHSIRTSRTPFRIWHLIFGTRGRQSMLLEAYLEDQVRVAFGDSATETVWDILSQDNIVQRE